MITVEKIEQVSHEVCNSGAVAANHGEFFTFRATLTDGRVILVHTSSTGAPTFEPEVDDDLAEEIFAELPE